MHFNAYDVFYSLNSHQYVQGDTSNFTRLQRYKRCVVSLPVCVRRCKFMVLDHLKDFLHTSHLNGRSPVLLRRCSFEVCDILKDFLCTSLVNWCSSLRVDKFLFCSSDISPISWLEPISASSGTRTVWIRKKKQCYSVVNKTIKSKFHL